MKNWMLEKLSWTALLSAGMAFALGLVFAQGATADNPPPPPPPPPPTCTSTVNTLPSPPNPQCIIVGTHSCVAPFPNCRVRESENTTTGEFNGCFSGCSGV